MGEENFTDEDLAIRVKNGEERAFSLFHKKYFLPLLYYTNKFVQQIPESENIVSQTFEKLWKLRQTFHSLSDMRAFMYTACRNSAFNFLRYGGGIQQKKEILTDNVERLIRNQTFETDSEKEIIETEIFKVLYEEIKNLPPQRKEIVHYFLSGMDTEQIAQKLHLTRGAVRIAKFKAINQLRKILSSRKLLIIMLITLSTGLYRL